MSDDQPTTKNRHAYVFYATNDTYAIAVLVFVRLLRQLGVRDDTDLVVLHLRLFSASHHLRSLSGQRHFEIK